MTRWRTFALTAALVGAAGVGAGLAPRASGQVAVLTEGEPQILEVIGGSSRIGVSVQDVTEEDVKQNKLRGLSGALVSGVQDDTPAATAGFKSGDVVVEFDGERVRSARQLTRLVQETPSGRTVQAVVMRDGQRVTLSVTPREAPRSRAFERLRDLEEFGRSFRYGRPVPPTPPARPAPAPRAPRPPRAPELDDWIFDRSSATLGITVDSLSDQLAEYFGTKDGLLVTSVREGSAAAKAGIKAGDVITALNGSPVTSAAALRRGIQRLEDGAEFTVDLVRDRKPVSVKGKVEGTDDRRRTYRSIV